VRDNLNELQERLLQCQALSQEYRGYQKDFHLEVTRFDTLDAVMMEVKQRQTLWSSVLEWKEAVNEWHRTPFHKLDVEEVINMNTKIIKNCAMLDKNLPSNDIVPQLKEEAELFKKKIPTLTNLRNPALKTVSLNSMLKIQF
jgi:dynein heavy chain, axonemal